MCFCGLGFVDQQLNSVKKKLPLYFPLIYHNYITANKIRSEKPGNGKLSVIQDVKSQTFIFQILVHLQHNFPQK